jgi:hypothetical protein
VVINILPTSKKLFTFNPAKQSFKLLLLDSQGVSWAIISITTTVGTTTFFAMRDIYMEKGLSALKKKPAIKKKTGVEAHFAREKVKLTSGWEDKRSSSKS